MQKFLQSQFGKPISLFLLGALNVLGFAPFYLFPISLISIAALFYLWQQAATPKAAFWLGFQYGLGLYSLGIYWIYISLHDFGGMPWWFAGFATFCLCAFMALFPALVGWLSKKTGALIPSPLLASSILISPILISAPIIWGLSDWVRSWIFTGFPWLTLGYSQVPYSPLAGFMPLVGVYGVSVIAAFLAALFASLFIQPKQTVLFKRNAIAAIVLIIVSGNLLKAVEWTQPVGKPFSVALLQGNIAQDIKWSPDTAKSTIEQYLTMVKASNATLIILPETALPIVYNEQEPYLKETLVAYAKRNQGDIIVGMIEQDSAGYFNSALSFNEFQIQNYRKNHLVPFGEFIPFKQIFGWIYRDWLNMPLSDLTRGGAYQKVIDLSNKQAVGMNICYEDVFGEEIIRQLPAATLLVNISNDAWYGQSFAAHQHMQFSQARALETGRMMLRATNTGATVAIDQHGYVFAHAKHDTTTTLNTQAQGYEGSTPYIRWGNWPYIGFSFSVLLGLMLRKWLSKKTA
ncbi:MAG: apolipoprotein N-acyltransferase [Methylotenera sp.]